MQVPRKTTISSTKSSSALKGGDNFRFIQGTLKCLKIDKQTTTLNVKIATKLQNQKKPSGGGGGVGRTLVWLLYFMPT
jgi:mevalonate kinase